MKRLLHILIFLLGAGLYAQTDGLTYQAVILDPNIQELPGVNASGNILPNAAVTLRFTITNSNGEVDYREQHSTQTDAHGIINLVIGQGEQISQNAFTDIFWNGAPKNLRVEINLGDRFNDLNEQTLTFVPYAFHRDITATGTLRAEGDVLFGGNLVVDGITNLNSSLDVNNESSSELTGILQVTGATQLNNSLDVNNQQRTLFTGTLEVDGATQLRSRLTVADSTQLNNTLEVNGLTRLKSTLDVEGATRLGDRLIVSEATQLNSTLTVEDATVLRRTLDVDGATSLNDDLRVDNQRPTYLSGTLTVDGESNFNSNVLVNNGSNVNVSGDMSIGGDTVLQQDVTVEGDTNLNTSLSVNNGSPTTLSGTLNVEGQTALASELLVLGTTDLNNFLRVNNASETLLTGGLTVGLATQLNGRLLVLNGSPTFLSGPLNVNGEILFGDDMTVTGIANFNDELNVLNGAAVTLSGDLDVEGNTSLGGILDVLNQTTLNDDLTVTNTEASAFTGALEVDGSTTINNMFQVTAQSPSYWSGTLVVDEATVINNSLDVTNGSATALTGSLTVDGITSVQSNLDVTNGSPTFLSGRLGVEGMTELNALNVNNVAETRLSGTLNVAGAVNLNNVFTIANATTVNNDLTVTGGANLTSLTTGGISVIDDNPNYLGILSNADQGDGGGILIKLGRDHGRWTGSSILKIDQTLISNDPVNNTPPTDPLYVTALNTVKTKFLNPGPFTMGEIVGLSPLALRAASIGNINNLVFQEVQAQLNFPKNVPSVTMPSFAVPGFENEIVFFNGLSPICSGQYCYSVCFPFAGCIRVCIPPVNVCVPTIPKIAFPALQVPQVNVAPTFNNFLPALPTLSEAGLPDVGIPSIPTVPFQNSLSRENEYMTFQDRDQRKTGAIRAMSIADFADSTILDDVYAINVASRFINIDLLKSIVRGGATMVDLINKFNKMGVEYTSGNGDYAEWLERFSPSEYVTPGDIVGVRGGKISKDLTHFEQLMVVSHRPIVLGNDPTHEKKHLGNAVAFIGQVPVKVIGPAHKGDYIVANPDFSGYGRAIAPENMKTEDFRYAVGRAWEENENPGPKMVNTVVGIHNGDFAKALQQIASQQNSLDSKLKTLEERIEEISEKLNTTTQIEDYAGKE
ncbi:hypothetical protein POV27_01260 [Aureisphaera galaxeae]|uniref:hypothetical protein n=1 Tax=Aureisphaera galaxeae TaxID=1538023 RepID=UPI002350911C|nr:hypothetical protein [Aureisphaera galaxeae]MDC8002666.1 hypothetical protein [Aureisphaera galaxeae]